MIQYFVTIDEDDDQVNINGDMNLLTERIRESIIYRRSKWEFCKSAAGIICILMIFSNTCCALLNTQMNMTIHIVGANITWESCGTIHHYFCFLCKKFL
ncbi:hypothetical protein HZS_3283 [Henneguya salminicola]|nr:hypothetical protein HZS_3283 [Henneguya salminicola]